MNHDLLIGVGLVLLGSGVIVYVAIARDQPLIYLSGLGVAAMGGSQVVPEVMSPGPARIGVRIFFSVVAFLAFWFQWRMARKLGQPGGGTPGQASGKR
jgi:hypothetical protein